MLKNVISTEHHPSLHKVDSMPSPLAPLSSMPHNNSQNFKEENENDYCYGGYHPVEINERFGQSKNYKIVRKLGWGHFSTVWLAFDSISLRHVALKIVRSDERYSEAAKDEIQILEKIKKTNPKHPGYNHLVNLLDSFTHHGPNGEHVVMVFELLGENLLGLLHKYQKFEEQHEQQGNHQVMKFNEFTQTYKRGLPLPVVKKLTKQLCLAFDYLHRECGLIHTDIKPENILIEIKNVEKFLDYLSFDHHDEETDSNNRSFHHYKKSPIKCSKPLPSPLTPLTPSRFTCTKKNRGASLMSRQASSVTYYETEYSQTSPATERTTSFSPNTTNTVNICASEACSDDEYDSEDEYLENLEFYKTSTNITTPSASRRSTFNHIESDEFSQDDEDDEEGSLVSLINVKIADLGNACYSQHHFTNDIQTRQYRAPEILLGHRWGCSTDCWSFACLIFELLTGDYLFDPKSNGEKYTKNEDHVAQILELIKPTDEELQNFVQCSKYCSSYFEKDCINLKSIKNLKYWDLENVLIQKYKFTKDLAFEISEFLVPLLKLDPSDRVDLGGWVNHPFLSDIKLKNYNENNLINREFGSVGKDINGWCCCSRK